MPSINELSQVELLHGLDEKILEELQLLLTSYTFSEGETILHQGDSAESLFLLLAGSVRVLQSDSGGTEHLLATIDAGGLFGERAFLTGERRTASVRAVGLVQVAELSRRNFKRLLQLCPEIYATLSRLLARQLGNWSLRHRQEAQESKELLTNLIGWQILPEFDSFPGVSRWAQELNRKIRYLADSQHNVLVLGERGTWKELVARLIHYHCGDETRPILYLDCADPPPILRQQTGTRGKQQDELISAIAQESALFGHEPDSTVYANGTRRGFLELAAGGELILENVEFLSPQVQNRLVDYLREFRFTRRGEKQQQQSRVRIIATSDEDIPQLARQGVFNQDLSRQLSREQVELKPLRERKSDIPVIAKRLLTHLNQKHHKQIRGLCQDTLNLLVDYGWPLNGQELQQVIDRAVAVSNDDLLHSEHIFLNIASESSDGRLNLFNLPLVKKIVQHSAFPKRLRIFSTLMFFAVLASCLFGPVINNPANILVWALWWPMLLLAALIGARSWCSYCPLDSMARLVGRWQRKRPSEPRWLKQYGPWISVTGLLSILMAEQLWDMFSQATGTAWLLFSLLGVTLLAQLLFGIRSWCKYLCPLGKLIGQSARISLVELRSNNNVCLSQCQVDDCIREKECPMGLHPTAASTTDDCVLCCSCVKQCPHDAICLDLRYPWLGLFERKTVSIVETLYAPLLIAAVLAIRLPALIKGGPTLQQQLVQFSVVTGSTILLIVLAGIFSERDQWRSRFDSFGVAVLPLALSGLFGLFFREFIGHGPDLISLMLEAVQLDRWLDPDQYRLGTGFLRIFLSLVVFTGAGFSWFLLTRIYQHTRNGAPPILQRCLLLVTAGLFLWCL
ncbi:MAG TPA: sigma 54-interacting transcriptional regulator [Geopsychrobacteraceae bacterium]|nr:sigma 54-interacting transcriptional regulator [Geopsychrobacteraceae bacterium]